MIITNTDTKETISNKLYDVFIKEGFGKRYTDPEKVFKNYKANNITFYDDILLFSELKNFFGSNPMHITNEGKLEKNIYMRLPIIINLEEDPDRAYYIYIKGFEVTTLAKINKSKLKHMLGGKIISGDLKGYKRDQEIFSKFMDFWNNDLMKQRKKLRKEF